tara:strand:+ start:852 stop:1247 length:396 start_codon:yes stop_codon:yes gene_type:complete
MIYNVSEMFNQSLGFSKKVNIKSNSSFYEGIGKVLVSESELNLIKTDSGIWVSGEITVFLYMECSRCLEKTDFSMQIVLNEEFLTGNMKAEDNFTIDDDNHLRLESCLREYIIINMPLKPICTKKCKLMNY